MREIVNKSKRKLTARSLVVDWRGYGTLLYHMSKARVKDALTNGEGKVRQLADGERSTTRAFRVRRYPSGSIAIGCEHFNKSEVAELRKWSRK